MPYEWLPPTKDQETHLHLWPYRSLPRRGMVWFIGGTAALLALPLVVLLGNKILWAMLPFLLGAVAAIWYALSRSYRDGEILEDFCLSDTQVTLTHHSRNGVKRWEANPHWVRVILHASSGPVPNYLTLQGGPREVEIGSFLSPEERLRLRGELAEAIAAHR